MNNKLVDWNKAKIHVLGYGLHYGIGVFEGIRFYQTEKGVAIFRLKDHLRRLENSAKIYSMKIPYSRGELSQATKKLIKVNNLRKGYIRPIVYRGYGVSNLNFSEIPVEVAIGAWSWGASLGESAWKKGIKAKISKYRRISSEMLPMEAKSTGQYVNSFLAKVEAKNAGCQEAILLDSRNFVSEGAMENIFLVRGKKLFTPPLHASILPGITRDTIIKIAPDLGYQVKEKDVTRKFLYESDEAFFSGTAAEIMPIREVDGKKIGSGKPGPVTRGLQKKYSRVVGGKEKKYRNWLDYV